MPPPERLRLQRLLDDETARLGHLGRGQAPGHRHRRRRARRWIVRQAIAAQARHLLLDRRRHRRQWPLHGRPLRAVLPFGFSPEHDLVQDRAQLPDVGALIRPSAHQRLRRHVRRRSAVDRGVGVALNGQAKVRQHQAPVGHAQDILWRDVAVGDADGVNGRQAGAQRAGGDQPFLQRALRPIFTGAQQLAQGAPRRQLHGDEPVAVGVAQVEDAADVGVADGPGHAHLARQAVDPALLARPFWMQNLNGNGLTQRTIPGAKHRPAAAFTDGGLDLVSIVDDRSDRQAGHRGRP